jgi:hypothetical protein
MGIAQKPFFLRSNAGEAKVGNAAAQLLFTFAELPRTLNFRSPTPARF